MENNTHKDTLRPTLDSLFDIESLRISPDYAATLGATKLLATVPCRKPNPQVFIRVRPEEEFRLPTAVIEIKEDREIYLLAPALREVVSHVWQIKMFYTAITRQGTLFLWPVRMPGSDGRLDTWNQSAHTAAEHATHAWTRVQSNRQLGGYDIFQAAGGIPEPEWPDKTMQELVQLAFKNHFIDSLDHPVLQALEGK